MSFRRIDLRNGGENYYLALEDWVGVPEPFGTGEQNVVEYMFESQSDEIAALFEELYYKVESNDENGNRTTTYYNCGLDNYDLYNNFVSLYNCRPMLRPFYPNSVDGNKKSVARFLSIIKDVIEVNAYKYRKLAETMGFIYNPIENYNMQEEGTDELTPFQSETLTHTVNAAQLNGVEVNGPVSAVTITEDQTTHIKTIDVTYDLQKKIGSKQTAASDVEAGQKVSTSGETPSLTTGTQATTKNFTTTMDDASTGRLKDYQETTGTTGQLSRVASEVDSPVTAKVNAGSPNHPSYSDTKTYTQGDKEIKDHSFSRHGNIGVTTTQQMIDQERQIVRFNVIREFYEDLAKELLLKNWN